MMFLCTIAAAGLAAIVLDDLHWADSESLLLLGFVARELRDLRLRHAVPGSCTAGG